MKKITSFKNLTKGQKIWISAKTLVFPAIIILPYLLQKYQINEADFTNPNNIVMANGHPLFSTQSLTQMIRFYGNSLQGMMAPFLEQNLNQFIEVQNQYVAHCQKIGSISSPESWTSFLKNSSSPEFVNPMSYFMNAGTQFWEQLQSQSPSIMPSFPFKPFKP